MCPCQHCCRQEESVAESAESAEFDRPKVGPHHRNTPYNAGEKLGSPSMVIIVKLGTATRQNTEPVWPNEAFCRWSTAATHQTNIIPRSECLGPRSGMEDGKLFERRRFTSLQSADPQGPLVLAMIIHFGVVSALVSAVQPAT